MQIGLATDVLLALLEAPEEGLEGSELHAALARHGRSSRNDQLLAALLRLEATDHVHVERGDTYRFALTREGRDRAVEVGGGRPVHVRLLMADLVDFVSFTAAHGDAAAHEAARSLSGAARASLQRFGGAVIKELGDGVLGWLPADQDGVAVARDLGAGCRRPDGTPWSLRVGTHVGTPIRSGGDLYGADVNLVARLCDLAGPGEVVTTVDPSVNGHASAERVEVRGIGEPVAIARAALA